MVGSLIVVYVGSEIGANYIGSVLNDNGIDCYLRNRLYQSNVVGWVDGTPSASTEVSVYEEDAERALEIIEEFKKENNQY